MRSSLKRTTEISMQISFSGSRSDRVLTVDIWSENIYNLFNQYRADQILICKFGIDDFDDFDCTL
jgi:hypothetical protein